MKPILQDKSQYEWAKRRKEQLINKAEDLQAEKLSTDNELQKLELTDRIYKLTEHIRELNDQINEYEAQQ